jgi:hypothetical protein
MNIGAALVEFKPVEREVWLTVSGIDDAEDASATVALTRRETLGLVWLLARAAVFGR